jgi:hypothetical protein
MINSDIKLLMPNSKDELIYMKKTPYDINVAARIVWYRAG